MNKFELVRKFGKIISLAKIDVGLIHLQKIIRQKNYLRAVIYHDTPKCFSASLERQFAFYQKHFSSVTRKDLDQFFQTGQWQKSKPGLIITFDDGLKSNFEWAYPLLEKFGFTGWFFVPTGFVDTPWEKQLTFAKEHDIVPFESNGMNRLAMNWEEIRRLDQNHVIGCHTRSHLRMSEELAKDVLQKEIVQAKDDLENRLGHPIDLFCWVGGELPTYTRQAYEIIQKTGYFYAFMTNSKPIHPKTHPLFLNRTYMEPSWNVNEVAFMLCGMMDLLYSQKRKKVAQRLGCEAPKMKPKILFFIHLPPPIHGVSVTNSRIVQSRFIQEGLNIRTLPISYSREITGIGRFGPQKVLKFVYLLIQLTKILIFSRPHLVYFSIVPSGIYFYRDAVFTWLIKLFRKKILFHLHGVGVDGSIQGALSQWIYRMTFKNSFAIAQSQPVLEDLKKIKGGLQKTYVVHNAIPLAGALFQAKTPQDPLVFINVSTIIPAKGQMDILKAAQRLLKQNTNAFKIILVGQVYDQDYVLQLKTFIQKNALEKYIDYKGALFGEEKEKQVAAADVFLFPSHNESFGLVSIEAMRAGLPVIATNVGSLPEIVEPGSGFLYPPGDIEKLAGHMSYFIKNKEKISVMGEKAFEVFLRKFTFEIFEQKMHDVFLDALQSAQPNTFRQLRDS